MSAFFLRLTSVKILLAFLSIVCLHPACPQDRTITGTVTSAESNEALPGVSIIITGTTTGTITDMNGNFRINASEGTFLSFSSVGFVTQTIEIGAQSVLDVVMEPDIKKLSEVVVIGYGTRERKDLTGAISDMESDEIEKAIVWSADAAMQGRLAGVLVTTTNGHLGNVPEVRIRGINTFGKAGPLYVIDGVPVVGNGLGFNEDYPSVNPLNLLNPADVESISVLKDASAAAIYGVRASNGVILITTKQGKKNQRPKIDLNVSYGISNFPETYDVLGVSDYVELYQESYNANPNYTLPGVFDPDSVNALSRYDRYLGDKPFIDWQEPFITKNAGIADAAVKIYGGNDNTNYYVSMGYTASEGNIIGNNMERYSLATNIATRAVEWLEVGVTYRFGYVETLDMYNPSNMYTLLDGSYVPPWQPIYLEDDYYNDNQESDLKYGFANIIDTLQTPNPNHPRWGGMDENATLYNVTEYRKYGPATRANWLAKYYTGNGYPYLTHRDRNIIRSIGNAYALIEPVKGLTFKGSLALDWYYARDNYWLSADNIMYGVGGNPWGIGDGTSKGEYNENHNRIFNRIAELTADWLKSFGDHNINLTLNAMYQYYNYEGIYGGSNQQASEDPDKWTLGGPREYSGADNSYTRYALQGYMGRLSYNYASKYYLDATVRYDGSSRFAPDYRWGTFPSFALAWRITAENFMSGINFLNDMKLRAGWGQLGNQETRPYAFLSSVVDYPMVSRGSGNGDYRGTQLWGISLPDFPTEDLSWETSTTKNIGVDAVIWNNRINLTVEYYDKLTEGILQAVQLPLSVGNTINPVMNVASVSNKGWEFQLGYNQRFGPVDVFFNGNFTTVKNNVEKVWDGRRFYSEIINYYGWIEEGYPMYYIYGYQVDGIYQSDEEVLSWWTVNKDVFADSILVGPGDMYFKDIHSAPDTISGYRYYTPIPDSVVNEYDRTYLGNTIAGYYYGFSFGVNWKGIDLSIFFQGVGDIQKYNWEYASGINFYGDGSNVCAVALNRWTPGNKIQWDGSSNKGKAQSIPRAIRADPGSNSRYSDRFVMDAGFLRLKNLTLGYSLPAKWLNRTNGIERVRFYISGQNLLTFTKWKGLDPEVTYAGIPIPRSWLFGLNATF